MPTDTQHELDILGQQPGLNLYTQLCFFFPAPENYPASALLDILRCGLDNLGQIAPWIGGHVVNHGATPGDSGTYSIGKLGQPPQLIVKDYREAKDFGLIMLRAKGYPASVLQESLYASRMTHPDPTQYGSPVFEVQLNLLGDGLIITIVGHHQVMDMSRMETLIRLLSKSCNRLPWTEQDLEQLAVSKRDTSLLINQDTVSADTYTGQNLTNETEPSSPVPSTTDEALKEVSVQEPCSWAFFNFPATALAELKDNTARECNNRFISTNDIITALTWQFLTKARAHRLQSQTKSKFGRAIDMRKYFTHQNSGLMMSMSFHTKPVTSIQTTPLSSIALDLRHAIDPKTTNLPNELRQYAIALSITKDKSTMNQNPDFEGSKDLMLSSWAGVQCYDLDFGLGLGSPEMVRRPSFGVVEGLAYFMPKTPGGDVALMICARNEDLGRLRSDEVFGKYAIYIG